MRKRHLDWLLSSREMSSQAEGRSRPRHREVKERRAISSTGFGAADVNEH